MCTLVFGLDVAGPGTVIVGANRDERPDRPTAPPSRLNDMPPVVGGRDLVSGGTWLAIRERHAVVALLNRRPNGNPGLDAGAPRSRGLLALDVAMAAAAGPAAFSERARESACELLATAPYAPFSLAFLSPRASWVMVHDLGKKTRFLRPDPGWHALTHAELDDPDEPRAAHLARRLSEWSPGGWDEARTGLAGWLSDHGEGVGVPVCIHDGPMPTVSSSIVMISPAGVRYAHREGRPCQGDFEDLSGLVRDTVTSTEHTPNPVRRRA